MPSYPHMMFEDTAVWSEYLKRPDIPITRCWYDVRVGTPVEPSDLMDPMLRKISAGLTRKRIDVVALCRGIHWVVEVKPYANYVALGQALTYRRLFLQEYRPELGALGVVVCNDYDVDMIELCLGSGVMLIQTGKGF